MENDVMIPPSLAKKTKVLTPYSIISLNTVPQETMPQRSTWPHRCLHSSICCYRTMFPPMMSFTMNLPTPRSQPTYFSISRMVVRQFKRQANQNVLLVHIGQLPTIEIISFSPGEKSFDTDPSTEYFLISNMLYLHLKMCIDPHIGFDSTLYIRTPYSPQMVTNLINPWKFFYLKMSLEETKR